MALLMSTRKLKAAATSMHQFLPVVRGVFPEQASDELVEAVTLFVYEWQAEREFGRRFAGQLKRLLRERYRFSDAGDVEERVSRIRRHAEYFALAAKNDRSRGGWESESTMHVVSTIRSLLLEAGLPFSDPELLQRTYQRFEEAVRRVRDHLRGISQQNKFIMK